MKDTLRRFSEWVWDWLVILSPLLVLLFLVPAVVALLMILRELL